MVLVKIGDKSHVVVSFFEIQMEDGLKTTPHILNYK
jgi:hypothetical protein